MTWTLLAAAVLVTAASRVLPMALLPTADGRTARVLNALPAPLFASLAAVALLGDGTFPPLPVLLAAAGALVGAVRRSLVLTLTCGITGFLLGQLVAA